MPQLTGSVLEHASYHHGETNLHATIINLAQDYVGSNNLNLLNPHGQFGSRHQVCQRHWRHHSMIFTFVFEQGGKDAAAARYINVSPQHWLRSIFNPVDDNLLQFLNEDGQDVEPEW